MTSSNTTEERVRREAYRLWEEAGRPHGRDAEFWQQACGIVEREPPAPVKVAAPPAKPRKKAAASNGAAASSGRKPRKAGSQPTAPST